jgi:hypothetical protein
MVFVHPPNGATFREWQDTGEVLVTVDCVNAGRRFELPGLQLGEAQA